MFLVSGITGHVGGAVARQLLSEGRAVRALVRDPVKAVTWARQGVELRAGEFGDPRAVAAALQGVEGAFLMMPPAPPSSREFAEWRAIIASYREALAEVPPPRLVVLSSIGSEKPRGLGPITQTHLLEQGLRGMAFPIAFVRAAGFLENYAHGLAAAASSGRFDTYLSPTNRRVMVVATEDIGREVALRLVGAAWAGTKVVELGSPYSPDELAHAMGEVLGRPVTARAILRDQWTARLRTQGLSPLAAKLFEEMEDGINSGWIAFGVPGAERVAGTITPAEFFRRAWDANRTGEDRGVRGVQVPHT